MSIADQRDALEAYLPSLTKRDDFELFWSETLRKAKTEPLSATRMRVPYPASHVAVHEITYHGFDDTPIHGWYLVPTFVQHGQELPCLIQYHGYGGSKGQPAGLMHWVVMGMAVLAVDCRGQGGMTGDHARYSTGMVTNVSTKGLLDKYEYYYRAVYMDCVKAIDFALSCPEVDPQRIVIRGTSQGGALGMAVCALDHRPRAALVNVPSNSNIERRIEGRHGSFAAVNDYLRRYPDQIEKAYETLSYFDTMNMADKIACPVYASVALADPICPADCYFASYNRVTSPKRIEIYPFNEHDGAHDVQLECELAYLRESGILEM